LKKIGVDDKIINKLARYHLGSIMADKFYLVEQDQKNVYNIPKVSAKYKANF
jgi:hypothetical protein